MSETNGPYVSSDDYGMFSQKWLTRVALRAPSHAMLLFGLDNMLEYVFEHLDHLDDPDSDCYGPDIMVALDVLVQTATTGQYVATTDPEDIPEGESSVMSKSERDKLIEEFNKALGIIPETGEKDE